MKRDMSTIEAEEVMGYHICGGTILTGGAGETEHLYCDRCRAFTYDLDASVPSGMDEAANRAAWDGGEDASPGNQQTTPVKPE